MITRSFYILGLNHAALRVFHSALTYAFLLLDSLRNLFLNEPKKSPSIWLPLAKPTFKCVLVCIEVIDKTLRHLHRRS